MLNIFKGPSSFFDEWKLRDRFYQYVEVWKHEGNGPIYLHRQVQLKCDWILAASEATTASKQPCRSNLTSNLNSVNPFTYLSMCIFLWYGPFLAASEATTASEVKTEFAGEMSDPNFLYDQVSRYLN